MTLSLTINKTLLNPFTAPACNVSVLHVFYFILNPFTCLYEIEDKEASNFVL